MKWIDASREKPPRYTRVIARFNKVMGAAEWNGYDWKTWELYGPPTHWKPQPPKVNRHARKKGAK